MADAPAAAARRRLYAAGLLWLAASSAGGAAAGAAAVHTVTIDGMEFHPQALTVRVGDRVRWVNRDLFPHTATADAGAFDSQQIAPGAHWTLTARRAGVYAYSCRLHPGMKASLTVQ